MPWGKVSFLWNVKPGEAAAGLLLAWGDANPYGAEQAENYSWSGAGLLLTAPDPSWIFCLS